MMQRPLSQVHVPAIDLSMPIGSRMSLHKGLSCLLCDTMDNKWSCFKCHEVLAWKRSRQCVCRQIKPEFVPVAAN